MHVALMLQVLTCSQHFLWYRNVRLPAEAARAANEKPAWMQQRPETARVPGVTTGQTYRYKQLPAKSKPLDQLLIARLVFAAEIRQQTAAAADKLEQTTTTVVVVRVRAQMVDQLIDALRQQRYLHIRGPGI